MQYSKEWKTVLKYIMAVLLLCLAGQADLRAGDDPPPLQTRGPLRQSRDNPRYFVDAGNRIVYLTGSHSWENFQDITQTFAYPAYLDRLASLHHNFIRLWVTELIRLEEDGSRILRPMKMMSSHFCICERDRALLWTAGHDSICPASTLPILIGFAPESYKRDNAVCMSP